MLSGERLPQTHHTIPAPLRITDIVGPRNHAPAGGVFPEGNATPLGSWVAVCAEDHPRVRGSDGMTLDLLPILDIANGNGAKTATLRASTAVSR